MEVLQILMREIFDIPLSVSDIKKFLDVKANSLKIGVVLRDPKLISNLSFRNTFKNCVGVWPSRQHSCEFMQKATLNGNLDIKEFAEFLTDALPLYKYLNIDIDGLTQSNEKYIAELRDINKVKDALALKFCYRFGIEQDVIDPQNSLLNVFKKCLFHPNGYDRIKQINIELAKKFGKPSLDIPDVPDTISTYYKVSSDIVNHYELNKLNIFSGYWNSFSKTTEPAYTIFDTINYVTLSDSAFLRSLLGSICVFWESGDIEKNNRLNVLLKSCNNKDAKNIILFKSIELPEPYLETDTYNVQYDVYSPYIMNFVSKLAANYILISEYLYPRTSIITTKAENSVYCCLYSEDRKAISPEIDNERILTNLVPFDRYVVYHSNYDVVKTKVEEKKIYVLVDEEPNTNKMDIIFNNEFAEHQWNAHLSVICPYGAIHSTAYHPRFNVLLYDQFIMRYYKDNKDKLQSLNSVKDAKNVVIMIDNRPNIFSVISIYITMSNLRQGDWSVAVVCNNDNIDFFKKYLGDKVEYITKFNYPSKKFSLEIYNDLLKSPYFWNTFSKYDKALFVQDDGMILKSGMEERFMKYDYVGAPWEKKWASQDPNKYIHEEINAELVGNGGVSLRNVRVMKTLCEKYKYLAKQLHYDKIQQQPEDVYFSYCCVKENKETPTYEEAQYFSSEQVINPDAFGFHKVWVYHHLSTIEALFNSYLTNDTKF